MRHLLMIGFILSMPILNTAQTIVCDTGGFVYNQMVRVTAPSGVNLRAEPSAKAAKLLSIPFGAEIPVQPSTDQMPYETIEDKSDYWYRASYAGKTGYVFGGFLDKAYRNTSIQFVVVDAGVDSQLDGLDLASGRQWYALEPRPTEEKRRMNDRRTLHGRPVKTGIQKGQNGSQDRNAPLDASKNTVAFFGGFKPNLDFDTYSLPEETKMLFPGETIRFDLIDKTTKKLRRYQLYATGQPVVTRGGKGNWPFEAIRNYALHLREVPDPGVPAAGLPLDQVLFSADLKYDPQEGGFLAPHPSLLGDIDGDQRLDAVLAFHGSKGMVHYLFLSSKALSGFLMRVVAVVSDSCC